MQRSPRAIFEQLFGNVSPIGAVERRGTGESLLDDISNGLASLRRRLGPDDRTRVSEYMEETRAVERRIQHVESRNSRTDPKVRVGPVMSVPESFDEHVDLLFELQRLAFRADITRVCSFKMGADRSTRVFPESGIATPFHVLSHHREDPQKVEAFATLNRYHVGTVARFLQRMRNTIDGEDSLLDSAAVLYGSPMGDSHVHDHRFLPLFVAGRANGQIKGNMHVRCAEGTPMANMLLTLAHKLGLGIDRIGDSTGEIAM
jgi:Protein of unknown function (DUF1552)